GIKTRYVEAVSPESDIRKLVELLAGEGVNSMQYYDVCDCWLEKRLTESCHSFQIDCEEFPTPLFINTKDDLKAYFGTRSKYFQTDFYMQQRKKLGLLLDEQGKPAGGKWSHDTDNREKYPKDKIPPQVVFPAPNPFTEEAILYVEQHFAGNYGE
ncbi:MAG: cryptochrome/photolyase family protein, partial [Bacteroidota bacterium]